MGPVRKFIASDAESVVERVEDRLRLDAARNPLINPSLDRRLLHDSLCAAPESSWVFDVAGRIAGHLYGTALGDRAGDVAVWTGPDGVSFDDPEVLAALVEQATPEWRARGADEHYVWCVSEHSCTRPWTDLGYALYSARGALRLGERGVRELPRGYALRRGSYADFDRTLELDAVIDAAQGVTVRSVPPAQREANRAELWETLIDPDTHHYVVVRDHEIVAQCITYPAPPRRGSFDSTLHLSEVAVDPRHQRRGIASALIDRAFDDARAQGFAYAETQWRVSNLAATLYWTSYGFQPTYVRLRRPLATTN